MGQEEIVSLIEELNKPRRKTETIKIWVGILGFTGIILSIGALGGNWIMWRETSNERQLRTEKTVDEHTKSIIILQSHDKSFKENGK